MVTCLVVMDGKDALSALVVVHITSVLSHCKRATVCVFGGSFFFFFSLSFTFSFVFGYGFLVGITQDSIIILTII